MFLISFGGISLLGFFHWVSFTFENAEILLNKMVKDEKRRIWTDNEGKDYCDFIWKKVQKEKKTVWEDDNAITRKRWRRLCKG